MSEQPQYYLIRDVHSIVKREVIYGKMGDAVTVIRWSDHVALVRDRNGDRFPVLQDDLTTTNIEKPNDCNEKRNEVSEIEQNISNIPEKLTKRVIRKTSRTKTNDSLSLF